MPDLSSDLKKKLFIFGSSEVGLGTHFLWKTSELSTNETEQDDLLTMHQSLFADKSKDRES